MEKPNQINESYDDERSEMNRVDDDDLDGGVLQTHQQVRDTYAEGTIDATFSQNVAENRS